MFGCPKCRKLGGDMGDRNGRNNSGGSKSSVDSILDLLLLSGRGGCHLCGVHPVLERKEYRTVGGLELERDGGM
jgi:hypothetical protein